MRTAAAMEVAAEAGAYQEMLWVVEACASRIQAPSPPPNCRRLAGGTRAAASRMQLFSVLDKRRNLSCDKWRRFKTMVVPANVTL
ncbi:hypothetical protein ZWY2020_046668 [Hordeum vulgare]|nr:hypothetical protein ZWY2020_046668 [Hordeum vulgare]